MAPHPQHRGHDPADQQHADPRARRKFRDEHDHQRYARGHAPSPFTIMLCSAPGPRVLRQCPTIPACDSVNARNAPIANSGINRSVTPRKIISKIPREYRQHDDSLRVDQAAPAIAERMRQKSVVRNRFAQARKIGERRVCRERQDHQDRADGEVIKQSASRHRRYQQRNHALIPRLARIGRLDAVGAHQISDSGQQNGEQTDDDGQRALRVADGRFAKGAHAVADGFDTGHGRAAVGKDLQDQPQTHRRRHRHARFVTGGATTATGCPAAKTVFVTPMKMAHSSEPRNA